MHIYRIILLFLICGSGVAAFSQTDPKVITVDSAMNNPDKKTDPVFLPKKDSVVNIRSGKKIQTKQAVVKDSARLALERLPRQAVMRSAIVPGLGQIKNGRWWKVPIIYGGFVGLGLAIDFNQRYYKDILTELRFRRNPDNYDEATKTINASGSIYQDIPDASLITGKDFYRRNRDLSILGCGVLYAINLIDAYVDAKFFRFDVSDDLAIKVYPSLQPQASYAYGSALPVIKLKLSL